MDLMRASQLLPRAAGDQVFRPVSRDEPAFPFSLGERGVHEIVARDYADATAATGFALAGVKAVSGPILWVRQTRETRQHGRLCAHGLAAMGVDPGRVLLATPRKAIDGLWAIEEGVRAGCVGLVLGELETADFTATRRLALASAASGVPVILRLPHGHDGATASAARWRVASRPSAPHRFDSAAPGSPCWHVVLERARMAPAAAGRSFDLEVDDETLSVRMASQLAPRTAGADPPSRSHWRSASPDQRRAS